MLEELKERVYAANLLLREYGLICLTWGNASGIDRARGLVVIKPSGVSYDEMKPQDMVVVRLDDGRAVEGELSPSSDTPTHLELYRSFADIGLPETLTPELLRYSPLVRNRLTLMRLSTRFNLTREGRHSLS